MNKKRDAAATEESQRLARERVEERIRSAVDEAPPLSETQRARLYELLRPVRRDDS